MIEYLKNHEIDREQWDNCIKASRCNKPYAFSWYLDIMAPGWEALVDDDYDSVFPLPSFKKFGIQYIATPIFLQQLGAFSPDNPASKAITEFLDFIPEFYKLIDLCVGQKTDLKEYRVTEKTNFELNLSNSYDNIWDNFAPHCKRNIETSSKKKPELVADIGPDEIIELFLKNMGKDIKGIKMIDYQRLNNLMNFCLKNRKGKILGVRAAKRRLIFGVFLIETEGNKTPLFVVNTPESRKRQIGYFFVNELIRNHSSTRTVLNFAGSSIPSIASFMESFGSKNVPYYRIYRNHLPLLIRWLK
jgi:hypothetical protein